MFRLILLQYRHKRGGGGGGGKKRGNISVSYIMVRSPHELIRVPSAHYE